MGIASLNPSYVTKIYACLTVRPFVGAHEF